MYKELKLFVQRKGEGEGTALCSRDLRRKTEKADGDDGRSGFVILSCQTGGVRTVPTQKPRARGYQDDKRRHERQQRSIPARAGEAGVTFNDFQRNGVYPCARGARGLAHENEISDEVYPCARGDVSEPFQSLTASRSDPGRGRRPDVARGPARRQASH